MIADTGSSVIGVFVIGFVVVAFNKMGDSPEKAEAQATMRNYVAIQQMANQKCPAAILKETGEGSLRDLRTSCDRS